MLSLTKTKPLGTPIMIFSAFSYIWGSQQGSEWWQVGQKWKKMDERKNIYMDYHMGVTSKPIILTSCTIRVMVPM